MRTVIAIVAVLVASLTAAQAGALHTHFGTLLDAIDVAPYLDVCDKMANTPSQGTSWTIAVAGQALSYTMSWQCENHQLSIRNEDDFSTRNIMRPGSAQKIAEEQTCYNGQCHNLDGWRQLTAQLCTLSKDADARMKANDHYLENRWYNTPNGIAAMHQQKMTFDADDKCLSAKATLDDVQRRVDEARAHEAD